MYNKSFSHGQRGTGSGQNRSRFGANSGRGYGRGGGAGRSQGRRNFKRKSIDVTRFINKVTITEKSEVFKPANNFSDFKIQDVIKKSIANRGFVLPTPIQDKIIPHILDGQDVVGMANTGTGKTAAFLIPLINKMLQNPSERALIMVPTRELALQIDEELKLFAEGLKIFSVVCVGGKNIFPQKRDLKKHPQFVIGTPGRLKDLIEQKCLVLSDFRNIVLDEADRMLDMGFIRDIKFIVNLMPTERQGMFFSATMSPEISSLIKEFLKEPLMISVKTREISENIYQDVIKVAKENRLEELKKLLSQAEFSKVLVFGETKRGVENISKSLQNGGFRAGAIHGNKSQSQRQKTLQLFRDNALQVLIATDVAARGLDIDNISHVINFEAPQSHEDYIHRIGRTGRGEKTGKALTFVE